MSMTGVVYRPPYEANSLLLQVTLGCSHNKCTFCYMYPDVKFTVCPMEQVEADIDEATRYCPDVERVFLEHGDAFVLSADRLMQIADAIHRKLPKVETIAMYASIQNIKHKTDAELRRLRDAGINGLDIGVESGLDAALRYMNKGHTAKEAEEQLESATLLNLGSGNYGYNINRYLDFLGRYLRSGRVPHSWFVRGFWAILCALGGLITGSLTTSAAKKKNNVVREATRADANLVNDSFKVNGKQDVFLGSRIDRRYSPRSQDTGTRSSSSSSRSTYSSHSTSSSGRSGSSSRRKF